MISNGLNGGGITEYSQLDLTAYLAIISLLTTISMKNWLIKLSGIVTDLLIAGSYLGGIGILVGTIAIMYILASTYQSNVELYYKALEGDKYAANLLNQNAFFKLYFYTMFKGLKCIWGEMF